MFIPIGSIVNFFAVLIGSLIGLNFGKLINKKVQRIIFKLIGIFTLYIGLKMLLNFDNLPIILVSLIIGYLFGEIIDLDSIIKFYLNKIKVNNHEDISDGLIKSFILFCIGSMTFIGSIEEGLNNNKTIIYTKSLMDGISSIILSSSMGKGVLISCFPLVIFQSILTYLAYFFGPNIDLNLINEISSLGGIIILITGINILGFANLNIINFLPSMIFIIPLYLSFHL
ncbi:MAG: hypothetical protein CMD07_04450 [Flavobacteriales bacterium]|nr:hypothetical protein [Flavobacteriales bacterium]|tara:strand:- start:1475 stop:2155 length:681 start_codon:yes stop_codon:yes gene_type:complete